MIPSTKVYTKVYTKEANKEVNSSSKLLRLTTLVLLMFMAGCSALEAQLTAVEEPEGVCLDYRSFRTVVEECTPLYGRLICIDKEKTRVVCTRRETIDSE